MLQLVGCLYYWVKIPPQRRHLWISTKSHNIARTKNNICLYISVRRKWKMHGQTCKRGIHNKTEEKKLLYEHRTSEEWVPNYGLLNIKARAQSLHLEFPCKHGNRKVLWPYFLPTRLTGAVHNDFLRNILLQPLQGGDLQIRIRLWLKYDSAPLYLHLAFRAFLNNVFP